MKVSIITVNYNNKSGLSQTAKSVLSQTYEDYEWIIIDGGSTDGSIEIIKENDTKIAYWVSESDKGVYHAMNKGISQAHGTYIHFLNSGDSYASCDTLKNVFTTYKIDNESIVFGNSLYIKDNEIRRRRNFHRSELYLSELIPKNINHQAMFFKKELFNKYGMYDDSYVLFADWKFNLLTIGINKCSTIYIDEDIVYYDTSGISLSSKYKEVGKEEHKRMLRELLPPGVLCDYEFNLSSSEIRKYYISKLLYSLIYRIVVLYEKYLKAKDREYYEYE